jgi:hypothetical protein
MLYATLLRQLRGYPVDASVVIELEDNRAYLKISSWSGGLEETFIRILIPAKRCTPSGHNAENSPKHA